MRARAYSKRRPVVLYQPRDGGWVMPLGLLALGSWLSGEHVVIVDGRFELAPEARIASLAQDALFLGVTVRTGAPLREALRASAAARGACPGLAVVWGGAHATLDPGSCLATGAVDACVRGAGEEAVAAIVTAVRSGRSLASVPGLALAEGGSAPEALPPTHLWPRADYSLLEVERHFEARGVRRLDYCSSRGARDGATWSGLRAQRVVAELGELAERYRLAEVFFRDDDFFADAERVEAVAAGLGEGGAGPAWQGGARVEDVLEASPDLLRLLARSGCLKLHVPVGPGAVPRALLREAGQRLRAAGLAASFAFEVAESDRGEGGLASAVEAARSLSALDPRLETHLRPSRTRAAAPGPTRTLQAWVEEEERPWSDARAERKLRRVAFFFAEAQREPGRRLGQRVVRVLALLRVRVGFFSLDLERKGVELSALLRTGRARGDAPAD